VRLSFPPASLAGGSAAILLASCKPAGILDPQGPIASAERLLLINSTAIMLVVVIPVIGATMAFAWWYRSSNARASRDSDELFPTVQTSEQST
jgi:cytochrome o ubiquinol oxidase subunit II